MRLEIAARGTLGLEARPARSRPPGLKATCTSAHTFHMESERMSHGDALRDLHAIQTKAAGMQRGHAGFHLAYTVLLAAYIAVLVFTVSIEGGRSVLGGGVIALVLPPIIISSGLISGANERFGVRRRATTRQHVMLGIYLLALGALLVWGLAGDGYPWWTSLVAAAATLVVFGARSLMTLVREDALPAHGGEFETGERARLARPARITTVVIGFYFGLLSGSVLTPTVAWMSMMLGLMAAIVALGAQVSAWGLLRTGYEWRRRHWVGFGVATMVMFALAVLIVATEVVTPALAIIAGLTVAASVIVPAFEGRGSDGASAS